MLQFGAVIGRICLDVDFHQMLFAAANPQLPFEDLTVLRKILRVDNGLDLSREDVLDINRILTENYPGAYRMPVVAYDQDEPVKNVRFGLGKHPLPFPDNVMFCGAFGLACVDHPYRLLVARTATGAELQRELAVPTDFHPKIDLTAAQAQQIRDLVYNKEGQIASLHEAKWIVPERIACSAGYGPDAAMLYASQTAVISYLFRHPDAFDALAEGGIVQGNLEVLRQVFNEGVEEARLHPSPPPIG
jgi:hypothetical protein